MSSELIGSLVRLLELEPGNHAVRTHLADLLLSDGQAAAALGHCEIVLGDAPGDAGATQLADRARKQLLGEDRVRAPGPDDVGVSAGAQPTDAGDEVSVDDLYELFRPEVTLDDVAGMEAVKERIRTSFLEPMRNEELRRMYGATMRSGLLLYGPPGCGKTFIARALAGELGLYFVSAGLSDLLDRWFGESEKNLRRLFHTARRNAPSVLFLDEIDAIGHRRTRLRGDGGLRSVVNQLLTELDGVDSTNEGVLILGATNQPWDIDPALRRPGRFDRQLLVVPPDRDARVALLESALRGRPVGHVDLGSIARDTEGYSGADLAHVIATAAESAMSDSVRTGVARPIEMRDVDAAVAEVRPSCDSWFESARPFAQFSNDAGEYDELLQYVKARRAPRRRR